MAAAAAGLPPGFPAPFPPIGGGAGAGKSDGEAAASKTPMGAPSSTASGNGERLPVGLLIIWEYEYLLWRTKVGIIIKPFF